LLNLAERWGFFSQLQELEAGGTMRDIKDMADPIAPTPKPQTPAAATTDTAKPPPAKKPVEIGGPSGPEPTRYGDWERGGRCVDF
jgi:hypothetical protein